MLVKYEALGTGLLVTTSIPKHSAARDVRKKENSPVTMRPYQIVSDWGDSSSIRSNYAGSPDNYGISIVIVT